MDNDTHGISKFMEMDMIGVLVRLSLPSLEGFSSYIQQA